MLVAAASTIVCIELAIFSSHILGLIIISNHHFKLRKTVKFVMRHSSQLSSSPLSLSQLDVSNTQ